MLRINLRIIILFLLGRHPRGLLTIDLRRLAEKYSRRPLGRNELAAQLINLCNTGRVTRITQRNWSVLYTLTKGLKMPSKCPTCKRAKCKWVDLKPNPEKLTSAELERIVAHNMSYIEMVFAGHQGSAFAEERMYNQLNPYCDELEKRKTKPATAVAKTKEPKMAKEKLSLGGVLRAKRESMAMDRAVLAKKIGITPGYYGLIETSAPAHVSEKLLGKIVKALGVKSDLTALREEHNQINRDYEKGRRDAKAKLEKKGAKPAAKKAAAPAAKPAKKGKAGTEHLPTAKGFEKTGKKVVRRKAKTSATLPVTEPTAQQPVQ